jgi:uncharacterized membrane protein YcaP (DUF421 family)
MDLHDLAMTALRALAVYALMLAVIRFLGKRTVGNFTAFDLLVALMLGEVVDEIIYGDIAFSQGMVAVGAIALAQYGNSWLSYWDHGLDKILEGTPTVVVQDGALRRQGLRTERMNEKDALAELRLQGVEDLREVKLAMIENDGHFSVIRQDWAEPLQKADLDGEAAKQRDRALKDREEPPPGQKTTAPRHRS